jgi:hypothetical protein
MGIAVRTGSPLSLVLAEPLWKQVAGQELTPADLTELDRDYVPGELGLFLYLETIDVKSSLPRAHVHQGHGGQSAAGA